LRALHFEYQYPKNHLAREVPIYYGSKGLKDSEGRPVRADIVIYATATACSDAFNQVVERTKTTILLREKLEKSQSEMQSSVINLFSKHFGG